jgi:2-polyprenyl-6-methoxyphenol hydroxylase-like FAD-dependent oxidoreductase
MDSSKRALVVGLGIAGMSAAIGLKKAGWDPVIIERTPDRRRGGYFIGLFAEGRAAAERLGVYDTIHRRTPATRINWEIDEAGRRERAPGFLDQPGDPQAVLRGDIEAGLWSRIDSEIDVRFNTVPVEITSTADAALVTLRTGSEQFTESFGLVVGADGLRSTTRRLVFGPDKKYMRSLNAMICAFQLSGPLPHVAVGESAVLAERGRSLWLFGLADTSPTLLFTYRTKKLAQQFRDSHIQTLRATYHGFSGGGIVEHALDEFERAEQSLFD